MLRLKPEGRSVSGKGGEKVGRGLAKENKGGNAYALKIMVEVVVMALRCTRKNGQR